MDVIVIEGGDEIGGGDLQWVERGRERGEPWERLSEEKVGNQRGKVGLYFCAVHSGILRALHTVLSSSPMARTCSCPSATFTAPSDHSGRD